MLEQSCQHEPLIGNAASVRKALESNIDNHATHIGIFPSDQILFRSTCGASTTHPNEG